MRVDSVPIATIVVGTVGGMAGTCGKRRERNRGADEGFFGDDGLEHSSWCAYVLEG